MPPCPLSVSLHKTRRKWRDWIMGDGDRWRDSWWKIIEKEALCWCVPFFCGAEACFVCQRLFYEKLWKIRNCGIVADGSAWHRHWNGIWHRWSLWINDKITIRQLYRWCRIERVSSLSSHGAHSETDSFDVYYSCNLPVDLKPKGESSEPIERWHCWSTVSLPMAIRWIVRWQQWKGRHMIFVVVSLSKNRIHSARSLWLCHWSTSNISRPPFPHSFWSTICAETQWTNWSWVKTDKFEAEMNVGRRWLHRGEGLLHFTVISAFCVK